MQEARVVGVGLNGLNSDWLWKWSRATGRSRMPQPPVLTDEGCGVDKLSYQATLWTRRSSESHVWIDVVYAKKLATSIAKLVGQHTIDKAILGRFTIGSGRTQLELLAANMVHINLTSVPEVATTLQAPGPIRRLMRFFADTYTRAVQRFKSLIWRISKDQEDWMERYIIITMVIACGWLAKSESHMTMMLHATTARQAHKMARGSQQQMVKLLECGIGIWPMQLPRYAEVVMLADEYEDTLVRMKETDDPHPAMYGNWQELVHPLGGTYYYHSTKYYYVVPDKQVIAWLKDLNGELLFGECIQPRLELEAQYWKHFEFFPHEFRMESPQVRHIRRELLCYIGESPKQKTEATTLSQSSAASMFWTLNQMNQIGTHLATIESLANNEIIEETGVVFCYCIGHHQFLNRHNQPEACLIRNHAVREKHRRTSTDGILNGVEVNSFVDDFTSQARSQITLAGVSMAMDIAILAIPGLGTMETSQTLCRLYIRGHDGATLWRENESYYLQQKTKMFIIITSIPTSFCVLRITSSVTGSILGFLSGVATDFKPSAPLMVSSIVTLGIVVSSLLVLVLASYGPGPARGTAADTEWNVPQAYLYVPHEHSVQYLDCI
ncbi:hypothetical protein DFH29DRAFT_875620 [Suillus ampliporus]|nr:hypothetical protein DFH29DRAFT_875620 [Suillus ampliporus]